jgi:hypothetical protein
MPAATKQKRVTRGKLTMKQALAPQRIAEI